MSKYGIIRHRTFWPLEHLMQEKQYPSMDQDRKTVGTPKFNMKQLICCRNCILLDYDLKCNSLHWDIVKLTCVDPDEPTAKNLHEHL